MTTPPFSARLGHLLLGLILLRCWMRLGYRATVRRSRKVPSGPCVLAANHRSFMDPTMAAIWGRDPVAFFARDSLWKIPPIAILLDLFWGIPVDRDRPGMSSMQGAIERLRSGMPVLVFPEGTRTKTGRLGALRDGPALFARRAGVPLVPVYVYRTERAWTRGSPLPCLCGPRLEVRFGAPIVAPDGLDPRASDRWVTERLRLWLIAQERSFNGGRVGARDNGSGGR